MGSDSQVDGEEEKQFNYKVIPAAGSWIRVEFIDKRSGEDLSTQ